MMSDMPMAPVMSAMLAGAPSRPPNRSAFFFFAFFDYAACAAIVELCPFLRALPTAFVLSNMMRVLFYHLPP